MLDEVEFARAHELYGQGFRSQGSKSFQLRFKPLLDIYKQVTGRVKLNLLQSCITVSLNKDHPARTAANLTGHRRLNFTQHVDISDLSTSEFRTKVLLLNDLKYIHSGAPSQRDGIFLEINDVIEVRATENQIEEKLRSWREMHESYFKDASFTNLYKRRSMTGSQCFVRTF